MRSACTSLGPNDELAMVSCGLFNPSLAISLEPNRELKIVNCELACVIS